MNSNMQHNVLFLISLSDNKIQELKGKGIDYRACLDTIRSYSHVEVHAISRELIASAAKFDLVVIIGHQVGDGIELPDGKVFSLHDIPSSLPPTFSGYLHIAVCGSSVINEAIKQRCPQSKVRTSNQATQLELHLLTYLFLLKHTDLCKENFSEYYSQTRGYIKELQDRNATDLAALPLATKLGQEAFAIKNNVFAPKKAKLETVFMVQVYLHYDSERKVISLAQGHEQDTEARPMLATLKDIYRGDSIVVQLTMLDEQKRHTDFIKINNQGSTFEKPVTIKEQITEVSFDVLVVGEYFEDETLEKKSWARLEFFKNSERLITPFDFDIIITKKDPQNIEERQRSNTKLIKDTPRATKPAGRKEGKLFLDDNNKTKWKELFVRFLEEQNDSSTPFFLEAKLNNFVSKAFVSFYIKWKDMGKIIETGIPNGSACFRFLRSDCDIENITPPKQYSDFIRNSIGSGRIDVDIDHKVTEFFVSNGLLPNS